MSVTVRVIGSLVFCVVLSEGYNNGQGLRPAMGWNTWCTQGTCGTDICNEDEVKEIADAMKSNGMFDAGYTHINLDDCWGACTRDSDSMMQPAADRFPSGILNLTDHLHSLGYTFGLYTSAGNQTCSKGDRPNCYVPGSYGYYTQDANTFASWGVDYVKIDWCGHDLTNSETQHTEFSNALNATGRSIWLELCRGYSTDPPPDYVSEVANSWRVTTDHFDSWSGTYGAIEAVAGNTKQSGKYNWAYNDFLMTGGQGCNLNITSGAHCPGMTDVEYVTEFTMWAITASPLIVATNVKNMTDIMTKILLNKDVIAINQENETPAGDRIFSIDCDDSVSNACQVWTRLMSDGSIAVVLYNAGEATHEFGVTLDDLQNGWSSDTTVAYEDLWDPANTGNCTGFYSSEVESHAVNMVRMYDLDYYYSYAFRNKRKVAKKKKE